jgi:hypothetical protein
MAMPVTVDKAPAHGAPGDLSALLAAGVAAVAASANGTAMTLNTTTIEMSGSNRLMRPSLSPALRKKSQTSPPAGHR